VQFKGASHCPLVPLTKYKCLQRLPKWLCDKPAEVCRQIVPGLRSSCTEGFLQKLVQSQLVFFTKPLQYTASGTGHTLQCLGRLSLLPIVGWHNEYQPYC